MSELEYVPTTYQNPEVAQNTSEALSWLTHIANDERKLLILLILSQQGPLSNSGILRHLKESADDELRIERADINSFVKKNFYKVDAINDTEVEILHPVSGSRIIPGYELTVQAEHFGVPLAGAMLDWARRNPGMPLKRIFGMSKGEDGAQSPLRRYFMLYDMATAPENPKGPSAHAIAADFDIGSDRGKLVAATRLVDFGWVTKETHLESNRRTFTIINPNYETGRGKRKFEQLRLDTQLLYRVFGEAIKVSDCWTVDDFFAFAAKVFPDADPKTLHAAKESLRHSLVGSTSTLRRAIKNNGGAVYDTVGKVQLKPEFVEPVLDLIGIIDSFCVSNKAVLAQGHEKAAEIMSDPNTVRNLFMQAVESSNYLGKDTEKDDALVSAIITESEDPQTKQAIRSKFIERTGRKVTLSVIQKSISRLLEQGDVVQIEGIKSKHNHTRIYQFGSIAVSSESSDS